MLMYSSVGLKAKKGKAHRTLKAKKGEVIEMEKAKCFQWNLATKMIVKKRNLARH